MKLKHIMTFVALSVIAGAAMAGGKTNKTKESLDILESSTKTLLIDVRTAEEFKEGTYEGAVNIPLNTLLWNIDKLQKYDHVIVFCHSGNRSQKAKQLLEVEGFVNVYDAGSLTNMLIEKSLRNK